MAALLQNAIQKIGALKWLLIMGAAGFILGVLAANMTKSYYISNMGNFDLLFLLNIKNLDIDRLPLFWMVLGKRLKEFFFIWIFSVTILWHPYAAGFSLYKGFMCSFLLTVSTVIYGFKGLVLIAAYSMPQLLIYVPVFLAALLHGYSVHYGLYNYSLDKGSGRRRVLAEQLPVLLLLLGGLLTGCFLESYVNLWMVKKALLLF